MATRSVYEAPAVPPEEMTPEQQEQFAVAQVAMIAAAAGAQKKAISDATTLTLIPFLKSIDFYNPVEVAQFAARAAEYVEEARQRQARVSWAAAHSRLAAYGIDLPSYLTEIGPSRTTALEVAYERPAKAYRMRMAAGTDSIKKLIATIEEQRFIELGGTTEEERNAEVEAPTGAKGSKPDSNKPGQEGGSSGASKAQEAGDGGRRTAADLPEDARPDADDDDFDFGDAEDELLEAARVEEDRLLEEARLTEEERQELLAEKAMEDAEERLERMINDDIAMARRDTNALAMQATPDIVTGYRRVLHPELAESGMSCGLCVAASTMIYKKTELMPIHNLCNCEQVEVFENSDPGDQINQEDLLTIYEDAGTDGQVTTSGRDLKKVRYVVFDHPELGPVLRNASNKERKMKFSARETDEKARRKVLEKRAETFGR